MNEIRIANVHLFDTVTYTRGFGDDIQQGTVIAIDHPSYSWPLICIDNGDIVPLFKIRSVSSSFFVRSSDVFQNPNFSAQLLINKVVFNGPATIVWFTDGTKTIVKKTEGDTDDREKAILLALTKKLLGNSTANLRKYLKDAESKVDNQNKKGE